MLLLNLGNSLFALGFLLIIGSNLFHTFRIFTADCLHLTSQTFTRFSLEQVHSNRDLKRKILASSGFEPSTFWPMLSCLSCLVLAGSGHFLVSASSKLSLVRESWKKCFEFFNLCVRGAIFSQSRSGPNPKNKVFHCPGSKVESWNCYLFSKWGGNPKFWRIGRIFRKL